MAAFPDLFAASVAGRQQAQREFADRLANLYAGGNMPAGQQLAGMDANRADQLRMALENMPASEQGKVAQRAQTLKKWLLTIQNDPDETAKPLLWNQMLGQLAGSGYDISTLPQSYSGASLAQAMNGVMTYEEMASALKASRGEQAIDRNPYGTSETSKIREQLDKLSPADPRYKPLLYQLTAIPQYDENGNRIIAPDPVKSGMYPPPRPATEEERKAMLADQSMPAWAREQLTIGANRPPTQQATEAVPESKVPATEPMPKAPVVGLPPKPQPTTEEQIDKQVEIQVRSAERKQEIENQSKLRSAKVDFANMRQWLRDLRSAIAKHGVSLKPNPEVQSAWSQALVNYNAKIAQLGALAGPDKQMLDQVITDPYSPQGLYYGKSGLLKQVDDALRRVDVMEKNAGQYLGNEQPAPSQSGVKFLGFE